MTNNERNRQDILPAAIIDQAERIAAAVFGSHLDPAAPILGVTDDIIIAPNLADCLLDPKNFVATNIDRSGNLRAFDLAIPARSMDPSKASNYEDVAYLYLTAVSPDDQHQGLVWPMHHCLFEMLHEAGYTAVEMDALETGNYTSRMKREYGEAITEIGPAHNNWGLGYEQPLRIDIEKYFIARQD